MVTVSTRLGVFSIADDGDITVGSALLRRLYDLVHKETGPSDGPLDWAVSSLMIKYIGGDYEILENIVPAYDKTTVY